jgi:hypothetical protein
VIYDGQEYEEVPAKAIREAVYKVLGIEKKKPKMQSNCSCGCDSNQCC